MKPYMRLTRKKQSAVLVKIDFDKAYDKVKWSFLYKALELKGFPDLWCDWIMKIVRGGYVGVKVNGQIGLYFQTHKGLRLGDLLSPLLFDTIADVLTLMVEQAKKQGLIKGLVADLIDGGLAILQYAYDTIFCCSLV